MLRFVPSSYADRKYVPRGGFASASSHCNTGFRGSIGGARVGSQGISKCPINPIFFLGSALHAWATLPHSCPTLGG